MPININKMKEQLDLFETVHAIVFTFSHFDKIFTRYSQTGYICSRYA